MTGIKETAKKKKEETLAKSFVKRAKGGSKQLFAVKRRTSASINSSEKRIKLTFVYLFILLLFSLTFSASFPRPISLPSIVKGFSSIVRFENLHAFTSLSRLIIVAFHTPASHPPAPGFNADFFYAFFFFSQF